MFLASGDGWLSNIGDAFLDVFYSIFWGIVGAVLNLLDSMQQAFFFLTGIEPLTIQIDGKEVEMTALELIFGISEGGYSWDFSNPIHKVFIGFLGVFVLVFVFCIICAIIKINMNRQDQEALPSTKKMFYKSGQAFFITILLPVIFLLLLSLSSLFMSTLINIMKDTMFADNISLSDAIFKSGLANSVLTDCEEAGFKITIFDEATNAVKDWATIKEDYGAENINLLLISIAAFSVFVGIGFCSLTVGERLINIVLLYFIAPFVCASIPLDDGKRWENWKDITTNKILTAAANVLSVYIYLYIISELGGTLLTSSSGFVIKLLFIIIIISGAFCCAKASTLIASIISANQGQQEGMSFAATRAMAGAAAKLTAGAAGVAGLVAFGKTRGKTSSQSNQNNQTNDKNDSPGNNSTSDTNYSPDSSNPVNNYNASQNAKMSNNQSGSNSAGGMGSNTTLSNMGAALAGAGGMIASTVPGILSNSKNAGSGTGSLASGGQTKTNKTPGEFKKAMNDVKKTIGKITNPAKKAANKISENGIVGGAAKILMGLAGAAGVAAIGGMIFGGRKLAAKRKAKKEEKQRLAQEKEAKQQQLAQERKDAGLNHIDHKEMEQRGINFDNPRERVLVDNVNHKRDAVWEAKQQSKDALAKYPEKLAEADKKYDEASKKYYGLKEQKARGENVSEKDIKEAKKDLMNAGNARTQVQNQPGRALAKQADAERKLANAEKHLTNAINKNTPNDLINNKEVEQALEKNIDKRKKPYNTSNQKPNQSSNTQSNTNTGQPKNEGLKQDQNNTAKPSNDNSKSQGSQKNEPEGKANTNTGQPKNEGLKKKDDGAAGTAAELQEKLKQNKKRGKKSDNEEEKDGDK